MKIVVAIFRQVYIFGLVDSRQLMVDRAAGRGAGLRPGRHWPSGLFFDILKLRRVLRREAPGGMGPGSGVQGALVASVPFGAGRLRPGWSRPGGSGRRDVGSNRGRGGQNKKSERQTNLNAKQIWKSKKCRKKQIHNRSSAGRPLVGQGWYQHTATTAPAIAPPTSGSQRQSKTIQVKPVFNVMMPLFSNPPDCGIFGGMTRPANQPVCVGGATAL